MHGSTLEARRRSSAPPADRWALAPRVGLVVLAALLAAPGTALADGAGIDGGDTAWILVSTALVLFMTIPGLALFYGGLVATKNVLSVLMQCLALTAAVTIVWLAFGYSLAFDASGMVEGETNLHSFVGGLSRCFLAGVDGSTAWGSIPEVLFFSFQMTFAIITPALIVGAFAERMKFSAMLLFSLVWLVVVYIPICHMTWGGAGGFFADRGVFDFAGGIVVHITAGIGALVACIVIGPRSGYGTTPMFPHNLTMTITGTAMLWVGWFGFNGGSALAANGDAAMAITVTHISASTAALTWMGIEWVINKKPSALGLATGAIAGLAAVTPASGFIGPVGGLLIGLASGALCFLASTSMKRRLGYDDSLDVFGVHGVGGFVGTVLAGVFAAGYFGGNQGDLDIASQVGTQLTAAVVTVVYTAAATWVILKAVDVLVGLRVEVEAERHGLDISLHDESGYRL
ncbi:MAG: ammonium transporter [Deltaproteobacteria bacterium]|nr:ammonium transporter [Deltaproteobacteria bacterium]MBW2417949.1 ammonium transporter [Deltaproteobacteria bacterium]